MTQLRGPPSETETKRKGIEIFKQSMDLDSATLGELETLSLEEQHRCLKIMFQMGGLFTRPEHSTRPN